MGDDQKIQELKEYFAKRDDVVMAFVFGSRAEGRARKTSDWDIGVYFRNEEENRPQEQEIWREVEAIVETNVDLVALNRAPAAIAWNVIRIGTPLAIFDRNVYLGILLKISHEANAWFRTAREYHRIFERSASLSEVDRGRLERVIQFLEQEVKDFTVFKKVSWQEYADEHSKTKRREVERWVEQLMNAVIDTAELILASERVVIPETYQRMVYTLSIVQPFNRDDLCQRLAGFTDLRNILAHEYLDYRWKEIHEFLQESEPYIKKFIDATKRFLEKSSPAS